jgi:hypothetical protein
MRTPPRITDPDPTRAPWPKNGGARLGVRSGSRQIISRSLTVRTPAPRNGGRARAGVGVADGVPLLGLPGDHVLFQPRAIAQDGAATQDGKRADLAAVPDLDRPGHPEGVGRHEHGQRAEEAAFAYPQQPEP